MEQKQGIRVPPLVIALALGLVALAVVIIGFRMMASPPPSASGIGPGGKPMTQEQINQMAAKMSGGKYQPPATK